MKSILRWGHGAYPIYFALFPILSVYSTNIESVRTMELFAPLVITACVTSVYWAVMLFFTRSMDKASLMAGLSVLFFFGFGPLYDAIRGEFGVAGELTSMQENVVLGGCFVCWAASMYGVHRAQSVSNTITMALGKIAIICLLVCVVTAVSGRLGFTLSAFDSQRDQEERQFRWWIRQKAEESPLAKQVLSDSIVAPATKPDIYFFVADAYARADFLSKTFGYDNAPFLAALRERGFHVSEGAYSNYDGTTFSLASTFSMDYLDDIQDTSASLRQFTKGAWQRLQECLAGRFFQYQGYEFVAFSTPFSGMQFSFADKQERPTLILSEYHSILMNITPITLLLRKLNVPFQAALHRQRISFVLDRLPQLVRRDKPLFVFGYVCCPHPPFVFRADGSPVDSVRPFTFDDGGDFRETGGSSQEYRDGYIAQLEFLNARLLTMIDGVLANNPGAVIVLAGDHGVRDFRNAGAQPPKRIEGMNILLAARMPEKDAATYFPVNATSVNTFRALLNAYWNAGLPILEPRAFSIKHVGQPPFVDVTNELSSP